MERNELDLNGLSRSFVRNQILITCSGSDATFSIYQHALTSHFARNPVVWKRNNKIFPHLLTFPLKFVHYEEKLCFGPQVTALEITKIAYLHIFNINVSTADEYRYNVRHNVSDWFAKLNSKSDIQWLIIINTTNCKDRKTKNAIIDKIKSDFSKYHGRLLELPDTTDHTAFISFVQNIQQCLFSHLNLVIDVWDRSLKSAYEKRKQNGWEPYSYFLSMTEYGRCHWSFGAIEFSISIFDDLEQSLHEFVLRASEPDSPRWLAQLLNIKIEDRPSLVKNCGIQNLRQKEAHYMGMRNYLLCQQIVMAVHLYQHKMRSNDAAPSLRSDCAIDILRRTLICIESVKEFNLQMNNKRDVPKSSCWTFWTVSEALEICGHLCDISHLDAASALISRLYLERFEAILNLAKHMKLNPEDSEILKEWLQINESSESKLLSLAICSDEVMAQEIEKVHDICVNFLISLNRLRMALNLNFKLFAYLRSINAKIPTQKLTINRKCLKALPCQKSSAEMLKILCKELFETEQMNKDTNMVELLFFMAQCENGEDEEILKKFEKLTKDAGLRLDTLSDLELMTVAIDAFEPIQTTDSKLTMKCKIDSRVGFDLKNSKVSLHFSNGGNIVRPEMLSVLSLQYEKKENTCRLLPEHKLNKSLAEEEEFERFVIESDEFLLRNGENEVEIEGMFQKIGCFVLEMVEISSSSVNFSTRNVSCRKPPVLLCVSTQHSVNLLNDSHPFYAGVLQELELELEARCDILQESRLKISPTTSLFKIFDANCMEFVDSLEISVPEMKVAEKRLINVAIWLKIDSSICESVAVQRRLLNIDWMSRRYSLPLNFVPLMVISSRTSMMTTNILLEVEVNRAAGKGITSTVIETNLEAIDAKGEVHRAESLTELPIKCESLSIVNFVWKLPVNGSSVKHRLQAKYKILDETPNTFLDLTEEQREKIREIEFSFQDEVELSVPEVKVEICTQVLSQQPGAQLCRAGSPCHFVISIRCLKDMPCTLFVVLDCDDRIWTLADRTKMVAVKESGLGQLALSIIPVVAGFLPFPSVTIYESQNSPGSSETMMPGNEILCFNRTAGKQIRVLSPNNSSDSQHFGKDESRRGSNRIAKKIVKLFD